MSENQNSCKKIKIPAIDFIKAFCALGIICYHFSIHSNKLKWLTVAPNHQVGWGDYFVVSFFVISGALLFFHHSNIQSVLTFYKKRCLSIYPTFYASYLIVAFLEWILVPKSVLLHRPVKYYLYTLLGMDGYLRNFTRPHNYYILGEWFLGAILLLYLLYPILTWLLQKDEKKYLLSVFSLFIITYNLKMFAQSPLRNIFSICFSFSVGMAIAKHHLFSDNSLRVISIPLFILFIITPFKTHFVINGQFGGIFLTFSLFIIGEKIYNKNILRQTISWLGRISYEIFLVQHFIILFLLKIYMPQNNFSAIALLLLTISTTIIMASVLHMGVNKSKGKLAGIILKRF